MIRHAHGHEFLQGALCIFTPLVRLAAEKFQMLSITAQVCLVIFTPYTRNTFSVF